MKLTAVKTAKKPRAFRGLASRCADGNGAPALAVHIGIGKLTAVKITENAQRINALTARGGF